MQNRHQDTVGWKRGILALALAVGVAGVTWAQDEPEQEEPPAPKFVPRLKYSWTQWGLRGSDHMFRRYATPARGFVLTDMGYVYATDDARYQSDLTIRGGVDQDLWVGGGASMRYGTTRFEGSYRTNEYYDNVPFDIPVSKRQEFDGRVVQSLGQGIGLQVRFSQEQHDAFFAGPRESEHVRTRTTDTSLKGKLLGGTLGVGYTDYRYWDRTNAEPDSEVQRWTAQYGRELLRGLDLQANYSHSRIKQPGRDDSEIETVGMSGNYAIGDRTNLSFGVKRDKIELPVVRTAYAQERMLFDSRLSHRAKNWSAQVAYRHKEVERVRKDQSFVDVPIWDSVEAKFQTKLGAGMRATVRGGFTHLRGWPVMNMTDPNPLFWTDTRFAQVKFDRTGETYAFYAILDHRFRKNDARRVDLSTTAGTLGATWDVGPGVSLFGEIVRETAKASGTGGDAANLDPYFPSSISGAFGVSYAFNPGFHATATFTHVGTNNDNPMFEPGGNYRGRYLTLGLTHRAANGAEFAFTYAPWHYEDKVLSSLGYNASVVSLVGKVRF